MCKQLLPVARANIASVVFLQPCLPLEKQKTKVTDVRIPLAEEYSMADVWCVWSRQGDADDHRDRIQPHTIRSLPQGIHNGVHKVLHPADHYPQQHTL